MPSAQGLDVRGSEMMMLAVWSALRPHWSSRRVEASVIAFDPSFAYCGVLCAVSGNRSAMTCSNAAAPSVTISSGSPRASKGCCKERTGSSSGGTTAGFACGPVRRGESGDCGHPREARKSVMSSPRVRVRLDRSGQRGQRKQSTICCDSSDAHACPPVRAETPEVVPFGSGRVEMRRCRPPTVVDARPVDRAVVAVRGMRPVGVEPALDPADQTEAGLAVVLTNGGEQAHLKVSFAVIAPQVTQDLGDVVQKPAVLIDLEYLQLIDLDPSTGRDNRRPISFGREVDFKRRLHGDG